MSTRNEGADGYSEPTAHDTRDTADRDPHRFDTRAPDLNGNGQPPAAPAQPGGIGGLAGLSNFAGMGSYTPTTHPQADEPAPAQPESNGLSSYTPEYTPPEAPNRPSVFPDLDNTATQTSSFDSFRTEEPRYEPPQQYEEPRYEQTRFEEPQYEEPRYEEPRVAQPQYQEEPRFEEPRYEELAAPEPRYDESRFTDPVPEPHQRVEPQFDDTSFDPSRFEPAPLGAPSFDDPHQAESLFEQPTRQEHRFEPAAPAENPRYEPSPAYQAILGADDEPSDPAQDYAADRRFDSAYDQRDEPAPVGDFGTVAAEDLPQAFHSNDPHFGAQQDYAVEPRSYEQREPEADFAAYPAASAGEPAFGAHEPDLPDHGFDAATGVQQYEARYDRHPEIPLGGYDNQSDAAEDAGKQPYFHETEEGDADFLGEEKAASGGKKRKFLMVACGLVGALALGGTLAYAYKTSGTFLGGSDTPPIIEADSRPVKVAPETPGGKEFPHKNKLIYDRLSGEDRPETEKLVSRQENVVDEVQNALSAREVPGTAPATETNRGFTPSQGRAEAPALSPEDGPRKVKTLVVRPDGTIVRQAVPETPTPAAPSIALPAPAKPEPPAAAPRVAAAPVTRVEPEAAAPAAEQSGDATPPPTRKPRGTAVASARPTPAPAAAPTASAGQGGEYVVQVGARRSQTAALAGFADLQQKYPSILSGYRPIIQKADLGNKGTWYRLRIGPLETKTAAADLCKKLKSAGMRSCLVNSR